MSRRSAVESELVIGGGAEVLLLLFGFGVDCMVIVGSSLWDGEDFDAGTCKLRLIGAYLVGKRGAERGERWRFYRDFGLEEWNGEEWSV